MTRREPRPPAASRMESVLDRMHGVGRALPADDGVAVFHRVYLSVTRELARRVADGTFRDPRGTAELGACFARRYLAAVEADAAGAPVPDCWRPLFRLRGHPGVRPLQFALAGINAHVGHDLPLAVVDACRLLGVGPPAVAQDFDRVGAVLESVEEAVREELMPGPDPLELAEPLTHLVGSWSLRRARRAAWSAARVLWGLRGLPPLYEEFADGLDAGAGLVGRCLLTPFARARPAALAGAGTGPDR